MPEVAVYAPGTPSWVDLATSNPEAARAFYRKIFGWDAQVVPDPEAGGYAFFTSNGKQVAGVGGLQNPQQPSAWSVYIATEDADASARAVKEAGGKVIAEPFDVMGAGRMAVFTDPAGAFISVWQAGSHKGAELVDEVNSFSWTELNTRDIKAAKPFYKKVFGWGAADNPMPQGGSYTEWKLGGKSIAGGQEMGKQFPANVPSHWLAYFNVNNTDETVKTAQGLGARVNMPPIDIPQGRLAVLSDPQGAVFAVIKVK